MDKNYPFPGPNSSLLPKDQAFIDQDTDIPGLAFALDGQRLARRLGDLFPNLYIQARPDYLRYKAGNNCLVGYRFCFDEKEFQGYVKAFSEKSMKPIGEFSPVKTPPLHQAFTIPDAGVNIYLFPADARVKRLGWLFSQSGQKTLGVKTGNTFRKTRLVKYHPEKRAVAALGLPGQSQIAAKIYSKSDFLRISRIYKAFAAAGFAGAALPTQDLPKQGMLLFPWLPGISLNKRLQSDSFDSEGGCFRAGVEIAALHCHEVSGLPDRTWEVESQSWVNASAALARILPEMQVQQFKLQRRLLRLLEKQLSEESVPLHGDFHPGQCLVDETRVTLIDLDRGAYGHPLIDLANFIAHLERDASEGDFDPSTVRQAKEWLIKGYESVRGKIDPMQLDLVTAGLLLKRILKPFRLRRLDWPNLMWQSFERAKSLTERLLPEN